MKNVSSIAATNHIICLRDTQIMIDCDLAELYQVTTKALNQAVKRNNARFSSEFKFQLTTSEMTQLVTECDRFSSLKHRSAMPYAFTEQGVAMLSAILKSELAIEISIQIMNAFVAMRKQIEHGSSSFRMRKSSHSGRFLRRSIVRRLCLCFRPDSPSKNQHGDNR